MDAFAFTRFEPNGMVSGHERIRMTTSVLDFIFRDLALARAKGYEGDPCPVCGHFSLLRNGTCLKCTTCGTTTGCS